MIESPKILHAAVDYLKDGKNDFHFTDDEAALILHEAIDGIAAIELENQWAVLIEELGFSAMAQGPRAYYRFLRRKVAEFRQ